MTLVLWASFPVHKDTRDGQQMAYIDWQSAYDPHAELVFLPVTNSCAEMSFVVRPFLDQVPPYQGGII